MKSQFEGNKNTCEDIGLKGLPKVVRTTAHNLTAAHRTETRIIIFLFCFSVLKLCFFARSLERCKISSLTILLCDTGKSVSFPLSPRQVFHSAFFLPKPQKIILSFLIHSQWLCSWRWYEKQSYRDSVSISHLDPQSFLELCLCFRGLFLRTNRSSISFGKIPSSHLYSDPFLSGLFTSLSVFVSSFYWLLFKLFTKCYDILTDHKSRSQTLSTGPALPCNQFANLSFSYHVSIYKLYMNSFFTVVSNRSLRATLMIGDYQIYISDMYPSSKLQMHLSFLTSPLGCLTDKSGETCPKQMSWFPALYWPFILSLSSQWVIF